MATLFFQTSNIQFRLVFQCKYSVVDILVLVRACSSRSVSIMQCFKREALFQLNSLLKKGIRKTNMALAVSQFQLDAVFISHARAKFVERQS